MKDPREDVIMRQKNVTDSVRSATIQRTSLPFRVKETPPEQRRGVPVLIPTPHLNGGQQGHNKKVEKKPSIPLGKNTGILNSLILEKIMVFKNSMW